MNPAENEQFPPVKTMFLKDGQLVTDPKTLKTGTFLGFPMRGWGDKVSYGVGLSYMLGNTN